MALTEEMMKKFDEKIKPFVKICPLCGCDEFIITPNIFIYHLVEPEKRAISLEKGITVILAECKNCYHILPFNARRSGIFE